MYGNYNVHFKLHVHGRIKFYRRPLVAHPCLMLFEQAICLVKNVFHLFFPQAKFFIDDVFFLLLNSSRLLRFSKYLVDSVSHEFLRSYCYRLSLKFASLYQSKQLMSSCSAQCEESNLRSGLKLKIFCFYVLN